MLEDMTAKSTAYAAKLTIVFEVLNVYPKLSLSSHLSSGSKNIRKRYGLRVSPCIVSHWIGIGLVFVKGVPINVVCELA